jgi:hypothetical protein
VSRAGPPGLVPEYPLASVDYVSPDEGITVLDAFILSLELGLKAF